MFSTASLLGSILFGTIGMAAFVYGKKQGAAGPMVLGLALMGYPYFVTQTWLLYALGMLLTGLLFRFRD